MIRFMKYQLGIYGVILFAVCFMYSQTSLANSISKLSLYQDC